VITEDSSEPKIPLEGRFATTKLSAFLVNPILEVLPCLTDQAMGL
jgi:hypothetical protein